MAQFDPAVKLHCTDHGYVKTVKMVIWNQKTPQKLFVRFTLALLRHSLLNLVFNLKMSGVA